MEVELSFEKRRTAKVSEVVLELFNSGKSTIRPGDVNAVMRERNMPMGTWEVRAEFSKLERDGLIACDTDTGDWRLVDGDALKDTA